MMKDENITFNVNNGQISFAKDNATIHVIQNNGVTANELDNIIKGIMDNLSGLDKEDADKIIDTVDMAREELAKSEPKPSRLRNCVTLISPMLTIVNGIPTLANNLQKLMNYITPYIN